MQIDNHGIYFEDFASQEACGDIVAMVENSELWHQALISNPKKGKHVNLNHRKQMVIQLAEMPNDVGSICGQYAQDLRKMTERLFSVSLTVGLCQLQRSLPGDFFNWHHDAYAYSAVLYLSDRNSHGLVGGSTLFRVDGFELSIEPQQGKVCIFDGRYKHKGDEVKAGIKYSLVACFDRPS